MAETAQDAASSEPVGPAVRAFLRIAGRSVVGTLADVTPEGLTFRCGESPSGLAEVRLLGGPDRPAVVWTAEVHAHAAGLRIDWPTSPEPLWTGLSRQLGLEPTSPRPWIRVAPARAARVEVADAPVEADAPSQPSSVGSQDPGASQELPSQPSGSLPPMSLSGGPARANAASLQATRGSRTTEPARVRFPVYHVQSRALAAALQKTGADLSPMLEIDGADALRPRDALALRVPVAGTAVYLEATVVTVRQSRARVRLTLASAGLRALLERGA